MRAGTNKKVLETEVPGGWRQDGQDHSAWINHLSPLLASSVSTLKTEKVPDNSSVPPARTPYWEQPLEAPQAVILGLLTQTYPSSATSPTLFSPRPSKAVSAPPLGSHKQAQAFITGILNTLHHGYSCSHLTPASDSALPRAETCWVPLGTTPSFLHPQSTCLAGTQQVLHKCLLDG